MIPNGVPVVAAMTSVTFPKSTPFVLTGSATDPNAGQAITYCWEQYNPASVSTPSSSNTTGPLFRSLEAVSVGYRYFPKFITVFNNATDTWELLPSVARTLTFRLTARDNFIDGGCAGENNITVTISNNGPLALTAPNGSVALTGNYPYTVTWNVAGTSAESANVDILYSTTPDNPTSYTVLLANTPNDGTQSVTMPQGITSSTFRIMVRSSNTNGIFFYDISNANNSITSSLPVELTLFTARKAGTQVALEWRTAQEVENKGFTVQRSTNNGLYFENIGWLPAATNGRVENVYTFVDQTTKPGNTYYYRLEQTDLDGSTDLSEMRSVTLDGAAQHLIIAPNPAQDYVLLTATGSSHEEVFEVTVANTNGQIVAQRTMSLNNNLPVNDWPAGIYTVRAVAGGKVWVGKVVR
jgi:hypothetical protein